MPNVLNKLDFSYCLYLYLCLFACLITLDSLSLNQFGEKDGGHTHPELTPWELVGRRDEGQARSIQLPLLLLSLCSTSTQQQQLGLAHPECCASWNYFQFLAHLTGTGMGHSGKEGNHCMRSLKASWGRADPKWMRMQGCTCIGMWVHSLVQIALILFFKKQFVSPLVSQGFTSEGKRKVCGLLSL